MNDMHLAIVGTRILACPGDIGRAARYIDKTIRDLEPDRIISGGAPGIDQIAEAIAAIHGYAGDDLLVLRPTTLRWAHKGGYRERNNAIVDVCTHLLRLSCREALTRGSAWTAEHAREKGRKVVNVSVCSSEGPDA